MISIIMEFFGFLTQQTQKHRQNLYKNTRKTQKRPNKQKHIIQKIKMTSNLKFRV